MTSAVFSQKFSFPQIWGFSPKKLFFCLIVHICIHMLGCINALSYKTYTFFDTHKNIDVMAIITIIYFYTLLFIQSKCLRQVGANAYPLIPGWDFRGTIKPFLGLNSIRNPTVVLWRSEIAWNTLKF